MIFHAVFSGPPASQDLFQAAIDAEGFPNQVDPTRGGFPEFEPDDPDPRPVAWIEIVAHHANTLDQLLEVAGRFGYRVRLHGYVMPPDRHDAGSGAVDPLADRVAQLEAQIAAMLANGGPS